MISLGAQRDIANANETKKLLSDIRDALIGFTVANGRLPCPASPGTTGVEKPNTGVGPCNNPYDGFLPAITLGISPTNEQGYAVDSWGNPIRYAVTEANGNTFTKTNEIKTNWSVGLNPNLRVCSTSDGVKNPGTTSATCNNAPDTSLTTNAVAIIFSTGKNGNDVPAASNVDELANWPTLTSNTKDLIFVSHTPTLAFDDIVIWLSPNILYNRMISAGKLP